MPTLLLVHHSPTASVQALTDAVAAGARDPELVDVSLVVRPALECTARDVLAADGLVLGTSANFGYMSGALKHFFDSTFLDVGGSLSTSGSGSAVSGGRVPYGLYVHGRYDVTGAVRSVRSITQALPWAQAAPVLEVLGDVGEVDLAAAYELGATLAAVLL